MNIFPSELYKRISKKGYIDAPVSRTIASSMDVGPAKVRRRSQLKITNLDFNMLLTDAEKSILKDFYSDNDALTFYFTNPETNIQETARFRDVVSFNNDGSRWTASVKLEILP